MSKSETGIIVVSDGPIPIQVLKPDLGLLDIFLHNLPFILTILIVVCAAVVTYRSNRKSVESQNELAAQRRQDEHENKISEFRHQWLQEVRETAASLCQIIHELQIYIVQRNIAQESFKQSGHEGDISNADRFSEEVREYNEKLKERRSNYYCLYSKLQLLFKKDEPSTSALFELLESIKDSIYDSNTTALEDHKIKQVIECLQVVLKSEWEVTKDRAWKNTQ